MKRKITGLFLVLAMCLLLRPESVWAEGEEQGSKTVITSVDELLKFAKGQSMQVIMMKKQMQS